MLKTYREHAAERATLGIPPLPLDAKQVAELIEMIKNPPVGEDAFLMDLLTHRVPPGVDDAAKVKASFLAAVAHGEINVALVSKAKATGTPVRPMTTHTTARAGMPSRWLPPSVSIAEELTAPAAAAACCTADCRDW